MDDERFAEDVFGRLGVSVAFAEYYLSFVSTACLRLPAENSSHSQEAGPLSELDAPLGIRAEMQNGLPLLHPS